MTTTASDTSTARERLTTTENTSGVRVRLKPEGLVKLAQRGDVAKLRKQIPMLEADQLAELLELLDPAIRDQVQDVQPAPPRPRIGRPPMAPAEGSPIAQARAASGMTKRELARALDVRDSAITNVEARGLAAAPPTIAKYLAPTGARLELVVTHPDGHQERYPVAPDAA